LLQSKQNARLKELRKALASLRLSSSRPARARLAGIEGPNLLEEAIRAGLRIACGLLSAQGLSSPTGTPRPAA